MAQLAHSVKFELRPLPLKGKRYGGVTAAPTTSFLVEPLADVGYHDSNFRHRLL